MAAYRVPPEHLPLLSGTPLPLRAEGFYLTVVVGRHVLARPLRAQCDLRFDAGAHARFARSAAPGRQLLKAGA
jgi:hypothetical protein